MRLSLTMNAAEVERLKQAHAKDRPNLISLMVRQAIRGATDDEGTLMTPGLGLILITGEDARHEVTP